MINNDSFIPLYEQVSNKIQEKILKGELKPGERIGSINELLKEYEVSRVTAVNALEDLVKRGFVVKRQGKGTFVKNAYIGEELMSLRSFKEISREGKSRIIGFEKITLPEETAQIFGNISQTGWKIRRLQLFKDEPIGLIVMLLPEHVTEKLTLDKELLERNSMFDQLENVGISVTTARQVISAARAEGEIADLLGLQEGNPILLVKRTSYDENRVAVMDSTFYYRSDSYSYTVTLTRNKRDALRNN
ncbi:GntR family transcriptional regulator [Synergistes jonesii]|uniref:GntR family transcriptional regulator n=1 Tax=Synergistes jonesii TaxID=2754 RepID=UPI00242C4667|nr:GntR family transcriptional regulator [Synergistes jonesii]